MAVQKASTIDIIVATARAALAALVGVAGCCFIDAPFISVFTTGGRIGRE